MRKSLVLLIVVVSWCFSYFSFGMIIEDSFTPGWDGGGLGSESAISPVSVSREEFPGDGTLKEVNQKIQDVEPVSPEVPEIPQNNLNSASEVPSELPAVEPAQSEIPFQQEENIVSSSIEDTARPSPQQTELNPETASGESPSIEERSGDSQERIIPPQEDVGLLPDEKERVTDNSGDDVRGPEIPSLEEETLSSASVRDNDEDPSDGNEVPAQSLGVSFPEESGAAGDVSSMPADNPEDDLENRGMSPSDEGTLPLVGENNDPTDDSEKGSSPDLPGMSPLGPDPSPPDPTPLPPMPVDNRGGNDKVSGGDGGSKGMVPTPDKKILPPEGRDNNPSDDGEKPPAIPLGLDPSPQDTPTPPPMPVDNPGDNDRGPGDDVGGKGMVPIPDRKTLPPAPVKDDESPPDDGEKPPSEPPGMSPLGPGPSPPDPTPLPPIPVDNRGRNDKVSGGDGGSKGVIPVPDVIPDRTTPPPSGKEDNKKTPDNGEKTSSPDLPGVSPLEPDPPQNIPDPQPMRGGNRDNDRKNMLPPDIGRDESNDESLSGESESPSEGISPLGGIISSEDDSERRLTLNSVDEGENVESYQIASFPQKREEKLEGHNLSYVGSSYREKAGAVSSGEGYSREDSAEGKYSFMENNEEGIRVASLTTDFSSAIKSPNSNIQDSASEDIPEEGSQKIVMGSTPTERVGVNETDGESIPEPPKEVRKVVDDVVSYLEGYERTLRQDCRRNDNSGCENISHKIGVIRRSIKESLDEVIRGVQEDMEGGGYAIKGKKNGWQLNYYVLPPDLKETRKLHRRDRR